MDGTNAYNRLMFHLTREVRFAINGPDDPQLGERPSNSYGGFPSMTGLGRFYALKVTLTGKPDAQSGYLLNIKRIDQAVRRIAIPFIAQFDSQRALQLPARLMDGMRDVWAPAELERLELALTPYLSIECHAQEYPMTRLSQEFEFAASHRLYSPNLDDQANHQLYGKCSNPHGHGHNYQVRVTVKGRPDDSGMLINVVELERIVTESVIEHLDHKYLNVEVPEFANLIPTVENIAKVIYDLIKSALKNQAELASVTVWETPKTSCEYFESPND